MPARTVPRSPAEPPRSGGDPARPDAAPVASPAPSGRRTVERITVLAVFALAGLLFSTSAVTAGGHDIRLTGRTDLADLVRDRDDQVRRLQQEVSDLRVQVDAGTDDADSAELAKLRS